MRRQDLDDPVRRGAQDDDRYGEQVLWSLVDALGTSDDPDRDLELLLGTREAALVRRAGDLMLATYEHAEPPP